MGKQYLNGVLYGTGEIIKFSPYIYSLEEREVGVWTDGKPLYQKSFILTNPTANDGYQSTGIVITDADTCCKIEWCAYREAGTAILYYFGIGASITESKANNNYRISFRFRKDTGNNIEMLLAADYNTEIKNIVLTARYTKATDTPWSGKYTSDGTMAHHYSTTEKVVGTWIDGKPLYETVVTGLNVSVPNNWGTEFATTLGIKYLIDAKFWDTSNPTNAIMLSIDEVQALNGGIRIRSSQSDIINYRHITQAILRYTKTTD